MWLTLTILGYFSSAIAAFMDKYILGGPLPSSKIYSFYAGLMSLLVFLIVPFGVLLSLGIFPFLQRIFPGAFEIFFIPNLYLVALGIGTGMIFFLALFFYYKAVFKFEVSRVAPAVGGLVPLFTFVLVYFFAFIPYDLGFQKRVLFAEELLAFVLLILGSVILSLHQKKPTTAGTLRLSIVASILFSLSFVLTKIIYSFAPFWTSFILIRLGEGLGAMSLLAFKEVRRGAFRHKGVPRGGLALPFVFTKGAGAIGAVLQNGAIFLAPMVFLPIINALAGIQYVFLIVFATLLFFKFPKVLKEEISKKIITQKIFAILLIFLGLLLLGLK